MNRFNYFLFNLFLISFAIITSCKKEEVRPAKSASELLTGVFTKTWKISDEQISSGGKTGSVFFLRETCAQDDLMVFYADLQFKKQEGINTCDNGDAMIFGKWALSSDKKAVIMEQQGYTEIWKIKELTASILKLEMKDPNFEGLTTIITYEAQK
jgi:hypothetical protein